MMGSEGSRPATMPVFAIPPVAPPPAVPTAAAVPLPLAATPSSLFHALRRCWLLALSLGLVVGGLVGTLWWLLIPESFRADIRVRIPAPWKASAAATASEEEIAQLQRTQAALLQSTAVLEEVLQRPEVQALPCVQQERDPLTWLGNQVVVGAGAIPDILFIRVSSARPEDAAVLAQTIAEVYRSSAAKQRQASLQHLKEVHGRTEEALRRKRQRLLELANSRLPAAERECQQARFDLRVARAELAAEEQRRSAAEQVSVSDKAVRTALKEDPAGARLLREVEQIEENIRTIIRISAHNENDPSLPELYRRRDAAQKKLQARSAELRPIMEQQERARALEQYQAQLNRRRERVVFCEGLVKSLEDELNSLGGTTALEELKTLREEMAAGSETLRKLAAEQERLESLAASPAAEEGHETVSVQPQNSASRVRSASLGGACCGVLMMLAVSWREMRLRRITSGSDILTGLCLPVVGNIASRRLTHALTRDQMDGGGRLCEAVDALRTVLLHDAGKGPRVILITSAVAGEGKTTLAALLAASLTRTWRKTLLLDADLRKPEAHQLFETPLDPGLSELLRGEAEAADVIQPTDLSRLWLIPAGNWDAHAIQALAQEGAARLFDSLKEQFDFIVIDACPLLPVADALFLSKYVDAVLLAVRSGMSRVPVVRVAEQRLIAVDAPLRGAVLMGPDSDVDGKAQVYPEVKK